MRSNRTRGFRLVLLLAGAASLVGIGPCERRGPVLYAIAQAGDPAPDLEGFVLRSLDDGPGWNEGSRLAFLAQVTDPDGNVPFGALAFAPGSFRSQRLVAAAGDPLPDLSETATMFSLDEIFLGPGRDVILSARLRDPGVLPSFARGLISTSRRGLQALAWEGGPVPGQADLVFAELPRFLQNRVNRWREITFSAQVEGPGVDASNDHVLMGPIAGERLGVIAREGDPVPGVPGEVFLDLDTFAVLRPRLDDRRRVGFRADYGPSPGVERGGLFRSDPRRGVEGVFLPGDQAPDLPEGVTIAWVAGNLEGSPGGALSFTGRIQGPGVNARNWDAAFVVAPPGRSPGGQDPPRARLVFRGGVPAPEPFSDFDVLDTFRPNPVNDRGETTFQVRIWDGTRSRFALYFQDWEETRLIAADGDEIPGLPGLVFDQVGSGQSINAHGDVLFAGFVRDAVTGVRELRSRHFVAPREGGFLPLLQRDDPVEVSPGVVRTSLGILPALSDRREIFMQIVFQGAVAGFDLVYACTRVPGGEPLRYRAIPCGRWRSDPSLRMASPLDDYEVSRR